MTGITGKTTSLGRRFVWETWDYGIMIDILFIPESQASHTSGMRGLRGIDAFGVCSHQNVGVLAHHAVLNRPSARFVGQVGGGGLAGPITNAVRANSDIVQCGPVPARRDHGHHRVESRRPRGFAIGGASDQKNVRLRDGRCVDPPHACQPGWGLVKSSGAAVSEPGWQKLWGKLWGPRSSPESLFGS